MDNIFRAIKGNSRDGIVNLPGLKLRVKSLAQGAKESWASNDVGEGMRRRGTEGAHTGVSNTMGESDPSGPSIGQRAQN